MNLGLIPARQGSKRLPEKNSRELLGKPLIAYAIETGLKIREIDKLIVSTDGKQIQKIALNYGAEVPFLRPKELAGDKSLTEEVVRHAVLQIEEKHNRVVEKVILLQPSSPFTTAKMVRDCIRMFDKGNWDSVVTVTKAKGLHGWFGSLTDSGKFELAASLNKEVKDMKVSKYIPSGNVYVIRRDICRTDRRIIGMNTGAVRVSEIDAIDIDYLSDFLFAEFMMKERRFNRN